MQPFPGLALALALTACVAPPAPAPGPGSGGGIPLAPCGAEARLGYIGQPLAALPADAPDVTRRVIRPGDAVTEDFSLLRLNVWLDRADIITQLTCG